MSALERTKTNIRAGHTGLNFLMFGSCLTFGSGMLFFLPISTVLGVSLQLATAATTYGVLAGSSYLLKRKYFKNLPIYSGVEAEKLRPVPEDHKIHAIADEMARQMGVDRPKLYIAEKTDDGISRTMGAHFAAFDVRALATADDDELRFMVAQALARQKTLPMEEHALDTHVMAQAFNITARVWYVGMAGIIALINPVLIDLLHVGSPVSMEMLDRSLGTYPRYMWTGIGLSALASFALRGTIIRNVTKHCDLAAVRACGTAAGAISYLSRLKRDFPRPPVNWPAKEAREGAIFIFETARQMRTDSDLAECNRYAQRKTNAAAWRLSRTFRRQADAFSSVAPAFISNAAARAGRAGFRLVNAFLSVGLDKSPTVEKRLRLIEKFAAETNIPLLGRSQERPAAPVPAEEDPGIDTVFVRPQTTPLPGDDTTAGGVGTNQPRAPKQTPK